MIRHPLDFDDMILLVSLSKTKSLTKTSKELHIAIGNLRKRMAKMEVVLGQTIYTRKSTGVELTKAGSELCSVYTDFLNRFEVLKANFHSLEGPDTKHSLTISTTQGIANTIIVPCLIEFLEAHPNYNPSLMTYVSERELLESHSDIIIWPKIDSTKYRLDLKSEHLATFHFGLFASEDYLKRKGSPEGLVTEQTIIKFFDFTNTPFAGASNELFGIVPHFNVTQEVKVNSHPSMYNLIKGGAGIGPVWQDFPFLKEDKLVHLFKGFSTATESHIVIRKDLPSYHPTKTFISFLIDYLAKIVRI